jgi:hypothetical protein
MTRLDDYAGRYPSVKMERRDGILQVTLHTEGKSLRWGMGVHAELPDAFGDIGRDPDNRVVIITGTGDEFSGPAATPGSTMFARRPSVQTMDRIHWEGRHLLMNLLNIEVPVISAVNGPAWRHSEIPLLGRWALSRRCCPSSSCCRVRGRSPKASPSARRCCCATRGSCSPSTSAAACMSCSATGWRWKAWP